MSSATVNTCRQASKEDRRIRPNTENTSNRFNQPMLYQSTLRFDQMAIRCPTEDQCSGCMHRKQLQHAGGHMVWINNNTSRFRSSHDGVYNYAKFIWQQHLRMPGWRSRGL